MRVAGSAAVRDHPRVGGRESHQHHGYMARPAPADCGLGAVVRGRARQSHAADALRGRHGARIQRQDARRVPGVACLLAGVRVDGPRPASKTDPGPCGGDPRAGRDLPALAAAGRGDESVAAALCRQHLRQFDARTDHRPQRSGPPGCTGTRDTGTQCWVCHGTRDRPRWALVRILARIRARVLAWILLLARALLLGRPGPVPRAEPPVRAHACRPVAPDRRAAGRASILVAAVRCPVPAGCIARHPKQGRQPGAAERCARARTRPPCTADVDRLVRHLRADLQRRRRHSAPVLPVDACTAAVGTGRVGDLRSVATGAARR